MDRADADGISTRTGLAGQQQLRSPRRGGPNQSTWPSAAFPAAVALRHGNLIVTHCPCARKPGSWSTRPLGPRRASWVLLPGKTARVTITSPPSTNQARGRRPARMSWPSARSSDGGGPGTSPGSGELPVLRTGAGSALGLVRATAQLSHCRAGRPGVPFRRLWTARSSGPCRRTCSSPQRPYRGSPSPPSGTAPTYRA